MLRLRWGAAALQHFGISLNSLASKEVHDAEVQPSEVQERRVDGSAVLLADHAACQQQLLNRQLSKKPTPLPSFASASHALLMARQSAALTAHKSGRLQQHAAL